MHDTKQSGLGAVLRHSRAVHHLEEPDPSLLHDDEVGWCLSET